MKRLSRSFIRLALVAFAVTILLSAAVVTSEGHDSELLNINGATVKELTALPGIGKKKAEAIVAYRQDNGKFISVEDLMKIEGIGKKTLKKLKEHISIGNN